MEQQKEMNSLTYVLKVLSGPLNGIEFSLNTYNYFVCVGSTTEMPEELARSLEMTDRSLYLPGGVDCHNFTVNLESPSITDEDHFDVTVHYPTQQKTLTLELNTICQVGDLYFALKHDGQAWSQPVSAGVSGAVLSTSADAQVMPLAASSSKSRFKWGYKLATTCVALLCFGSAAAWFSYYGDAKAGSGPEVVELEQLIGKQAGYAAYLGRDKTYYVFAQNKQQAEWAQQAVARSNSEKFWKIVTPQEEEARLARVLDRHNISFFTIRFTNPRAPIVVISNKNVNDPKSLEKNVTKMLMETLPYANTVQIDLQNDEDIIHLAQEGLLALGFDYQMVQSDQGVTLVSDMTEGDVRLTEFNRFAERFYRTWGRRYVHFSVELRDDTLKGKSFKYGNDGYVTMGRSHWLFNNQNNQY